MFTEAQEKFLEKVASAAVGSAQRGAAVGSTIFGIPGAAIGAALGAPKGYRGKAFCAPA